MQKNYKYSRLYGCLILIKSIIVYFLDKGSTVIGHASGATKAKKQLPPTRSRQRKKLVSSFVLKIM